MKAAAQVGVGLVNRERLDNFSLDDPTPQCYEIEKLGLTALAKVARRKKHPR